MRTPKDLNLIWKHTHRDYRGVVDGKRFVMKYRNGTTLVPLDALTDAEFAEDLAYAKRCEERARKTA